MEGIWPVVTIGGCVIGTVRATFWATSLRNTLGIYFQGLARNGITKEGSSFGGNMRICDNWAFMRHRYSLLGAPGTGIITIH